MCVFSYNLEMIKCPNEEDPFPLTLPSRPQSKSPVWVLVASKSEEYKFLLTTLIVRNVGNDKKSRHKTTLHKPLHEET